jgi:hypothetical protein
MEYQPGRVPETETAATFVVYDTTDGRIVHRHKVVTPVGAAESSGQDAEEAALGYADRVAGAPRDRIAVLRVAEEELRPGMEHRVDVEAGRVVAADDARSP